MKVTNENDLRRINVFENYSYYEVCRSDKYAGATMDNYKWLVSDMYRMAGMRTTLMGFYCVMCYGFEVPPRYLITSGIRCPKVNIEAGGVDNSNHLKGQAIDIWCEDMPGLWRQLTEGIYSDFNEVIWYRSKGIIHMGWDNKDQRFIIKK